MILLAMMLLYWASVPLLSSMCRKALMNPSNGVCHLQKLNSLAVGLCTVKCSIAGSPAFTVAGRVITVTSVSAVLLVAGWAFLQAGKKEIVSQAARMVISFIMMKYIIACGKLIENICHEKACCGSGLFHYTFISPIHLLILILLLHLQHCTATLYC